MSLGVGAAGSLPDEDEASGHQPATIPCVHSLRASDDPALRQGLPKEGDGVFA